MEYYIDTNSAQVYRVEGGTIAPLGPIFPPALFQKSVKHDIFSAPVGAKNLKIEAYFKLIFLNNFPTLVQQINHKKVAKKGENIISCYQGPVKS